MRKPKTIILPRDNHPISRRHIDDDALKVMRRLVEQGYEGYLVGGAVRDLLLDRTPKDFDVSTDAHPNQIRKLFRNCFLIGRRFRLAHIRFGETIVETSTFRCEPHKEDGDDDLYHHRDNTFGTPEEDARRRDFTINGMFYNARDFTVIDHVGGLNDIKRKLVRCIGDPDIRFQEDPVRMVRAIRFASRLGFKIERRTATAIRRHASEIEKSPAPRLLEEIYRLFAFQSGRAAMELLQRYGLMSYLIPELETYINRSGKGRSPLWAYLDELDKEEGVPHEGLLGALFYAPFLAAFDKQTRSGVTCGQAAHETLEPFFTRFKVPRRVAYRLIHMFEAQYRFLTEPKRKFSKTRFMAHDTFRPALSLYGIHVAATGADAGTLHEWEQTYKPADLPPPRDPEEKRPRRRRRRPRRRRTPSQTKA